MCMYVKFTKFISLSLSMEPKGEVIAEVMHVLSEALRFFQVLKKVVHLLQIFLRIKILRFFIVTLHI